MYLLSPQQASDIRLDFNLSVEVVLYKAIRMRKVLGLFFLVALFVASSLGCCSHVIAPTPANRAELISDETVALVRSDGEDTHTYCAGTWVARDVFLTANHCIHGLAEMTVIEQIVAQARAKGASEEDIALIVAIAKSGLVELPAIDEMSLPISFIIHDEVVGVGENPTAVHQARVLAQSPSTDLALVQALNVPAHKVAALAKKTPAVGEHIYTMGHPIGLFWSFMEGTVSAYHDHLAPAKKKDPLLQISMPIFYGNSGGGVFNDFGELVGVVSFMPPKVPNVGFCVHLDSIRGFLAGQHLAKLDLTPKKTDPAL